MYVNNQFLYFKLEIHLEISTYAQTTAIAQHTIVAKQCNAMQCNEI